MLGARDSKSLAPCVFSVAIDPIHRRVRTAANSATLPATMKLPVVQDKNDPWYADGLAFTCTQCGNCCTGGPGYVWISEIEVDRFAAHLKIGRTEFLKKYCRLINGKVSLKERRNLRNEYDCVFLKELEINEDGKIRKQRVCTAYDVRPLQCRTWPFWDGLLASEGTWNAASRGCPGINKGKKFTLKQIVALRDARDWPKPKDAPGSRK